METPWDYFTEIYCINLDHRVDRWQKVTNEFTGVGCDRVQRVKAVKFIDGRIGLIKSLLKIFKDVHARKVPNVLIFEDDVHFINNPLVNLAKAIEQIKGNGWEWDLLYLGATTWEKCKFIAPNVIRLRNALACHATAYSQSIYPQLIDHFERTNEIRCQDDINDVFLCNMQMAHLALMVNPIIATQSPDYSDLEKQYVDYSFIETNFKQNTL